MAERKKWYAIYTKPRWEKKVHALLSQKGVESYCPLNKVRRQWSDRIKIVEEPLFKSYVFVKVTEDEKTAVRMTNGVVNFVYWMGKPAIVKEKEIENIQKFLNEYYQVEVVPLHIKPYSKVRIQRGVLMDKEGIVTRVINRKVEIVIDSIGFIIRAMVDRSNIEVIKNNH